LTSLGVRGVPDTIKEAAVAFGASRFQLLKDVEVPLALPSIMTGVNQTILMCLSMVVIISLIGGGGLGKVILESLQYAAKGPGLLGGFAILFVAMVIDRVETVFDAAVKLLKAEPGVKPQVLGHPGIGIQFYAAITIPLRLLLDKPD
jgi:ABC-type proline/glycine betaine transport system permease subunit